MHWYRRSFIQQPFSPASLNYWGLWLGVILFNGIVAATLWNGVVPTFVRLEQQHAQEELTAIGQSLAQELEAHQASVTDMATWDDAYAFVQRFDPEFVQTNITPETFYPIGLAHLAFFDNAGRLTYGAQVNPDNLTPLPAEVEQQFRQHILGKQANGLIKIGPQILLVAQAPIIQSDGSGPSQGTYVVARRLTLKSLNLLDTTTSTAYFDFDAATNDPTHPPRAHVLIHGQQTQWLHFPLLGSGGHVLGEIVLKQQRTLYALGLGVFWRGMQATWMISALVLLLGHLVLGRLSLVQRERQHLEQRYRAVVEQATEGMALVDSQRFVILEVNQSLAHLLGHRPETLLGKSVLEFVNHDTAEVIRQLESASQGHPFRGEFRLHKKDGSLLEVEGSVSAVVERSNCFLLITFHSIQARKEAEQAVRTNEARLRQITDGMLDVVMLCDLEGRIEYVTPSSEKLFGYAPEELVGRHAVELVHPDYQPQALEALARGIANPSQNRIEVLDVHKDGKTLWVEVVGTLLYENGQPHKVLLGSRDITQRKRYENQITHLALHDPLTGLGNRRMLQDRAEQTLALARRKGWPAALLFLDLDRFKAINDTLGHDAGDELLIQIAWLLKHSVREEDILVRYSGDEFVVLLGEVGVEQARQIAAQLLQTIGTSLVLRGHSVQPGASIGIAAYPEHGEDLTALLKAADIAMYQAKRSGTHIKVYDPAQNPYTEDQLHLEAHLRQAIQEARFEFFYQPIQHLRTGQICGVESLARWQHQSLWITPATFIPLAEDLHLIERIDNLGLRKGLTELQRLRALGLSLELSVNLSAQTLQDPALPHYIQAMLETHGIPAPSLTLEITETVLLQNLERARLILQELRGLGVKIAIDDFGSGYASLAYLRHLPIHRIKLDRSLIQQIGHNPEDERLLRALIQLGHNLEMEVLAEGIETPEQLEWLREAGCDLVQGYLLGRPGPFQGLVAQLEQSLFSAPPAHVESPAERC
ncbi:MAG: EAL domain-containing protein [Meiothermus sp.]|nr:EAL domain-containing protein [Meiothermus sp.]